MSIKELEKKQRERQQQKRLEKLVAKEEHRLEIQRLAAKEYMYDPINDVPKEIIIEDDYIKTVANCCTYNEHYADRYYEMFENTNREKYRVLSEKLHGCHKTWIGDHYKQSGYFDVKRVFHCHNRWCPICNHLKGAKLLFEFHHIFDELAKDYDLYHIVFTVPNCPGSELKSTLNKMSESFARLIRYFQCSAKIRGIDFGQFGWAAAVRCFEIVINPTDFHPHLHCIFVMRKDLNFVKHIINPYSFKDGRLDRKFSDFEVLLQKTFYLLMNNQKVTLSNIQDLKLGYSAMADLVEGASWHECFKYITKFSKDGSRLCSQQQFEDAEYALHNFHIIQTYGLLRNKENEPAEYDPTLEILYEKVIYMLSMREQPEKDVSVDISRLADELREKYKCISKKNAYKYLQQIQAEFRSSSGVPDDWKPF